MIAATLFSGIGAPEVAMPDWRWPWCAEIDRFASAVHAHRHGAKNLGDVTADDFVERAAEIARPDVLVFGSPCQSFSVAGQRRGLDDLRGNPALVAIGIAARLRPRWLVFENVPGLLSSSNGRDFGLFLRAMEECGYFGAWRIFDAQFFGLAQRRERVFFVGCFGDWRPAAAVLFEPEGLRGDTAPRRETRQDVAGTLSARTEGGGGLGTDFELSGGLLAHTLRGEGFDANEDGTGRGTPLVPVAFSCKDSGADAGGIAPTLRAMGHSASHANAGGQLAIAYDLRGREGGAMLEGPHDTANIRAASGGSSRSYIASPMAVRRLTPRECERLQGFPDDFSAINYRGKPAADGPRYKALGNSMAVPVMRWILSRIERFESRATN
jgi:DNA (cytosine-5)-methyltransferase 1